jgi:hypothetical protein
MSFESLLRILRDHFWAEVGLRLLWFAVPVAGSLLAGMTMAVFLLHRMGNTHRNPLSFSTKGIGKPVPQDVVVTPKLPSLGMALLLVLLFGGFGVFYLSVLAGLTLSVLTVIGMAFMLMSMKIGMIVEGILWGFSVVTVYYLWKKQSVEIWYRIR